MSKYVMVDAVSQFRMRYVIEVPDDVENPSDPSLHPITPEEYAMDSVTCENAKEFTQKHIGETIIDAREVTLEEVIAQFRKEEPILGQWDDELIKKNTITPIGYDQEEEDRKFDQWI